MVVYYLVKKGVFIMKSEKGSVYRWPVFVSTLFSYIFDNYDNVILAISMPVLITVLQISYAQGGLLLSVTMVGAALGSMILGTLAENKGRRFALILSLVMFGVGTGLVAFIDDWFHWMILRFFTGIAIGGVWGPCVALVMEHWAPAYQSRVTSLVLSMFAVAFVFASLAGRIFLTIDWRILFFIGTTSILVAIYTYIFVPKDDVRAASASTEEPREKITITNSFRGQTLKRVIMGTVLVFFSLGGFWGAATWIPTFLIKERGLDLTTMANFSILTYVGMFIGYQVFGFLGDKIGRKRSILISIVLCVIAIPLYVFIQNGQFLFWWGAVVGFAMSGPFGVVGAYFSELFPEKIRALAGGFCFNMGRVGGIIMPFTVGALGQMYGLEFGIGITAVMFGCCGVVLCFMPETFRGQAQKDTEEMATAHNA